MKGVAIFMTLILTLVLSSIMSKAVAYTRTDVQQENRVVKIAKKAAKKHHVNREFIAVVDFSRISSKHRFFLVSLKTNKVIYSYYTSHGKNTGGSRFARLFSNVVGSHKSSLGVVRVGAVYYGKNGKSVYLYGLNGSNSNTKRRIIVLHPADYISKSYINKHIFPGRSLGCLTLDPEDSSWIIDKLKNGSIIVSVK
jgi:hypothetical protein